jgi:hypothetical protein
MRLPGALLLAAALLIEPSVGAEGTLTQGRGAGGDKARTGGPSPLVGAWKFVSREGASGAAAQGAVGLMIFDRDGHVGLAQMDGGRRKYAGSEPTPAEAKAAFDSIRSMFGTYSIDPGVGRVTLHLDGSLNPNLTGSDVSAAYTLAGDRLTFKPVSSVAGLSGAMVWERLPDATDLTPTHRRLIGFWKLVPNEGQAEPPGQDRRRGFISYTAAGYMGVHIMPAGRPKFAQQEPTPDEAKTALSAYTTYFGPYRVNEQERYLVHQRIGHIIPASIGTNAQRFYEFVGRRLVLKFVSTTFTAPTTLQTAKSEGREPGVITWERVSTDAPFGK